MAFLRVADEWQFKRQKQAAIKELKERGTPSQKIVAGRLYNEAKDLIFPAFKELGMMCTQALPTKEDAHLLGGEDLLRLWYATELFRRFGYDNVIAEFYLKAMTENGSLPNFAQIAKGFNLDSRHLHWTTVPARTFLFVF
jgi:hypothetical protein